VTATAIHLTREEIEAILWHINVVDRAYGHDHPADPVVSSVERKLELALLVKAA
jgi:hypothetical protein